MKKLFSFIVGLVIVVGCVFALAACDFGGGGGLDDGGSLPTKIELSVEELTVYQNEAIEIEVTISDGDEKNREWKVTSLNTSVLTTSGHEISIVGVGEADLRFELVASAEIHSICSVTVLEYVPLVSVAAKSNSLVIDFSSPAPKLELEITPTNATVNSMSVTFDKPLIASYEDYSFYAIKPGVVNATIDLDGKKTVVKISVLEYGFSIFEEDLVPVRFENGTDSVSGKFLGTQWYYVNYYGHKVLGPYKAASNFVGGHAIVSDTIDNNNYKSHAIDKTGKRVSKEFDGTELKLIYNGRFLYNYKNEIVSIYNLEGELMFDRVRNMWPNLNDAIENYLFIQTDSTATVYDKDLNQIFQTATDAEEYINSLNQKSDIFEIGFQNRKIAIILSDPIQVFELGDNTFLHNHSLVKGTYLRETPDGLYVLDSGKLKLLNSDTLALIAEFDAPSAEYSQTYYNGEGFLYMEHQSLDKGFLYLLDGEPRVLEVLETDDPDYVDYSNLNEYGRSSYRAFLFENGVESGVVICSNWANTQFYGGVVIDEPNKVISKIVFPSGYEFHRYLGSLILLKNDNGDIRIYDYNAEEFLNQTEYSGVVFTRDYTFAVLEKSGGIDILDFNNVKNPILFSPVKVGDYYYQADSKLFCAVKDYNTYYVTCYDGQFVAQIKDPINMLSSPFFIFEDAFGAAYLSSRNLPTVVVDGFTYLIGQNNYATFYMDGDACFPMLSSDKLVLIKGTVTHKMNVAVQYIYDSKLWEVHKNTLESRFLYALANDGTDATYTYKGYSYIYESKANGEFWIYTLDRSQSLKLSGNQPLLGNKIDLNPSFGIFKDNIIFGLFTENDGTTNLGCYNIEISGNNSVYFGDGAIIYGQNLGNISMSSTSSSGYETLRTHKLPVGSVDIEYKDGIFYYTVNGDDRAVVCSHSNILFLDVSADEAKTITSRPSIFSGGAGKDLLDYHLADGTVVYITRDGREIARGNLGQAPGLFPYNVFVIKDYDTEREVAIYIDGTGSFMTGLDSVKTSYDLFVISKDGTKKFYELTDEGLKLKLNRSGAKEYSRVYSGKDIQREFKHGGFYVFDDGFTFFVDGNEYSVYGITIPEGHWTSLDCIFVSADGKKVGATFADKTYIFNVAESKYAAYNSYMNFLGGYREADLEDLEEGSLYFISANDINGNTFITFFDCNLDVIAEGNYTDLALHGNILSVYDNSTKTFYYYKTDGTLISEATVRYWKNLKVPPVDYYVDGETLVLVYGEREVKIENLVHSNYGNFYQNPVGYDYENGVAMFWTKDNTWIIFDITNGTEQYRTPSLTNATQYKN